MKNRNIIFVKNKVEEWRKLFKNGFYDQESHKIIHVSLDIAAGMVCLCRKTLDDYYRCIT